MNPSQAVAIAGRHHYSILVFFVIGYILHVGLQADSIVRSKENIVTSRWFVVQQNAWRLAARFFYALCIFIFFWRNPSMIPAALAYLGYTPGPTIMAILTLPMSPPISGMLGFNIDSLLAFIPKLKNVLPAIEMVKRETTVLVKETRTSEIKVETTPPPPSNDGGK